MEAGDPTVSRSARQVTLCTGRIEPDANQTERRRHDWENPASGNLVGTMLDTVPAIACNSPRSCLGKPFGRYARLGFVGIACWPGRAAYFV
jgi:hypothetical protein